MSATNVILLNFHLIQQNLELNLLSSYHDGWMIWWRAAKIKMKHLWELSQGESGESIRSSSISVAPTTGSLDVQNVSINSALEGQGRQLNTEWFLATLDSFGIAVLNGFWRSQRLHLLRENDLDYEAKNGRLLQFYDPSQDYDPGIKL